MIYKRIGVWLAGLRETAVRHRLGGAPLIGNAVAQLPAVASIWPAQHCFASVIEHSFENGVRVCLLTFKRRL